MFLRKIFLLLWKNLVLLRRHYIVTACEIILPCLAIIAVAYIKAQLEPPMPPPNNYDYYNPDYPDPEPGPYRPDPSSEPTWFPEINETVLRYIRPT